MQSVATEVDLIESAPGPRRPIDPKTADQTTGTGSDLRDEYWDDDGPILHRPAEVRLAGVVPDPDEQEQIRRVQTVLRKGDPVRAYRMACEAIETLGETSGLRGVADAIKRRLRAQIRVAMRTARQAEVIPIAEALLDDPEVGVEAAESLINAGRQTMNDGQLALLLADVTDRQADNFRLWQALANFVAALPAEPRSIEKGFEVLEHLPGNERAISGLTDLLRRYEAD